MYYEQEFFLYLVHNLSHICMIHIRCCVCICDANVKYVCDFVVIQVVS